MSNAKVYLQQVRRSDINIENKLAEIDHLRNLILKVTSSMKPDTGSRTGNQDKLGSIVSKIVDLENELNREIGVYVDKKREVGAVIDGLQNESQVQVLHKRYFEHKTWEKIACEMNMTCRNVWYIHGRALQSVNVTLESMRKEQMEGAGYNEQT